MQTKTFILYAINHLTALIKTHLAASDLKLPELDSG